MDQKANNLTRKRLQLQQHACAQRKNPTVTEARLWSALKARQLGVQFRRQVPLLDRYIADFVASSVRLVVEVDGGCHVRKYNSDARRDVALGALGYRVLRLDAALVGRDLRAAIALVRAAL